MPDRDPTTFIYRGETVVQWISAGLELVKTRVQSYSKLDFFSVNTFCQKDAC